jgi:hypothetical protein
MGATEHKRATAPKRAHSPIVQYGAEGRTQAPQVLLYDAFGVPLPNADQRNSDVHGRPLQPATSDDIPYRPAELDPEDAKRLKHEKWLAKQRAVPFTKAEVDPVRYRVMMNLARTAILECWNLWKQPMRHLWFPTPGDIDEYEMREGNAPAVGDRPRHLRRCDLAIDLTYIPREVREAIRPGGLVEHLARKKLDEEGMENMPTGVVLQMTIAKMAEEMAWRGGKLR